MISRTMWTTFLFTIVFAFSQTLFAQRVRPVAPPTTYDGQCSITNLSTAIVPTGGIYDLDQASMDFGCSGTFIGQVTAELHFEYVPSDGGFHFATRTPDGSVSRTYPLTDYWGGVQPIPASDNLSTWAWRDPGYLAYAIATVRWETDAVQCGWYGCWRVWQSQTVVSGPQ